MATIEQYGDLMRSQLGVHEDPPESNRVLYSIWYGAIGPWCEMFQNWAHVKLGMTPPGFDPAAAPKGSAFTPTCADWFRRQGRWTTTPHVGDLVYYDFPADGINRISHVGWVEEVHGPSSITAIEGNTDERGGVTGGKVMRKNRTTGIVGYGRPNYEEDDMGLTDADKTWIATKLEESERRIARYVDHGNAATVGSGNHHEAIRADLAVIAHAVGELEQPATTTPGALSGTFTLTGSGTVQGDAE